MSGMTLSQLKAAAREFAQEFSAISIAALYGKTDGKAVGTHVEHAFHEFLKRRYSYVPGSSAIGLDFPELEVDLKVTSIKQGRPQSSSPFRDASEKVYGLGHHLLVFTYVKVDNDESRTATLDMRHAVFVARERTGDYQTTREIREILFSNGSKGAVMAFLRDSTLPLDETERENLANRILRECPEQGFLGITGVPQWRLRYGRVIDLAAEGATRGVEKLFD